MSDLDFLDDEPGTALVPADAAHVQRMLEQERKRLEAEMPRICEETAQRAAALETINLAVPAVPDAPAAQQKLFTQAWRKIDDKQRVFLFALRDANFSERAAVDSLLGTRYEVSRGIVRRNWINDPDFQFCRRVLQQVAYDVVVDKQRLILRANEIAEQAMVPKPILYHGVPTGFYELQAQTVLAANEQILKAAGHLKSAEAARVRVRIVNLAGPEDDKDVIEGTAVEVEAEVPGFME